MTPKAQVTKLKINELDFIKVENFGISKDIIKKVKRQPIEWGKKYLQITYLRRDLYLGYIKKTYNSIKINIPIFLNKQRP